MTAFQILLLAALFSIGVTLLALLVRGMVGRVAGIAWLAVIGAGIVFAIKPNLTTTIANALGISRGTDLLLYLLVIAVLYGFLLIYLKLRRVRRELTLLVREIAIREATRNGRADASRDARQETARREDARREDARRGVTPSDRDPRADGT